MIVYERRGGLTAADKARIDDTVEKLNADRKPLVLEAQPPVYSPDGARGDHRAAGPARRRLGRHLPGRGAVDPRPDRRAGRGLEVKLTGAAGFSLDAIKVFSGINGTLLLRGGGDRPGPADHHLPLADLLGDPVLHASLLAEGASRGAGYLLAEAGVTINGQTGGILPVLVFGAGTDYALLLVSRYREELRRHEDKHEAMAIALRSAGPAILASGLTVIAALLTLSIAEVNSTAGLGPVGAMGVALAMISMLTVLPALLAIFGRRAFWSPGLDTIPHPGQAGTDETHGFWRRVGDRVARRPRAIWVAGAVVLLVLAANVLNLDTSQTTGNQFRGEVDSVAGPGGALAQLPGGRLRAGRRDRRATASKAAAVTAALQAAARPRRATSGPAGAADAGAQLAVDLQGRPVRARRRWTRSRTCATSPSRRAARHARRRPDRAGVRPARRPRRATTS